MKIFTVAVFILSCFPTVAQEFKPYPRADISKRQWQTYFDEVVAKHGNTAQKQNDEKLVIYADALSNTSYVFTQDGHPAHPAWITRQLQQRAGNVNIGQIGYFAGDEAAFAALYRSFSAQNEQVSRNARLQRDADASLMSVSVETNADGALTLVGRFSKTVEIANAQQSLKVEATKACGTRPFTFGKYSFKGSESISKSSAPRPDDSLEIAQVLVCGDSSEPNVAGSPPQSMSWSANEKQLANLTSATNSYFKSRDTGDGSVSYQALSSRMKSSVTEANWNKSLLEFNAKAGKFDKRDTSKPTWYPNSNSPEGNVTFVAVDFNGKFENLALYCGYIVWMLNSDDSFSLIREETNVVDNATASRMKTEDLNAFRTKHCR